jgi:hypothetical protein
VFDILLLNYPRITSSTSFSGRNLNVLLGDLVIELKSFKN